MNAGDYGFRVEAAPAAFFETPVVIGRLKGGDALIDDLEAAIRSRMAESEGLSRSNTGGWHSDTQMLEWGGPAAKRLADTVVSLVKRMSHITNAPLDAFDWPVEMWANVSGPGAANHLHVHPQNLWACVLYVNMGDGGDPGRDVGGELYFEDPRFPMSAMRNVNFRLIGVDAKPQIYQPHIRPQRGMLIAFPAWLRHGVRPYTGEAERISIALNIDVVPRAR